MPEPVKPPLSSAPSIEDLLRPLQLKILELEKELHLIREHPSDFPTRKEFQEHVAGLKAEIEDLRKKKKDIEANPPVPIVSAGVAASIPKSWHEKVADLADDFTL